MQSGRRRIAAFRCYHHKAAHHQMSRRWPLDYDETVAFVPFRSFTPFTVEYIYADFYRKQQFKRNEEEEEEEWNWMALHAIHNPISSIQLVRIISFTKNSMQKHWFCTNLKKDQFSLTFVRKWIYQSPYSFPNKRLQKLRLIKIVFSERKVA